MNFGDSIAPGYTLLRLLRLLAAGWYFDDFRGAEIDSEKKTERERVGEGEGGRSRLHGKIYIFKNINM